MSENSEIKSSIWFLVLYSGEYLFSSFVLFFLFRVNKLRHHVHKRHQIDGFILFSDFQLIALCLVLHLYFGCEWDQRLQIVDVIKAINGFDSFHIKV